MERLGNLYGKESCANYMPNGLKIARPWFYGKFDVIMLSKMKAELGALVVFRNPVITNAGASLEVFILCWNLSMVQILTHLNCGRFGCFSNWLGEGWHNTTTVVLWEKWGIQKSQLCNNAYIHPCSWKIEFQAHKISHNSKWQSGCCTRICHRLWSYAWHSLHLTCLYQGQIIQMFFAGWQQEPVSMAVYVFTVTWLL